jgi:hypothetical protein
MARSFRYHPLFDSDVLYAAEWYDGRQPNLGFDFVVRVRRAVEFDGNAKSTTSKILAAVHLHGR